MEIQKWAEFYKPNKIFFQEVYMEKASVFLDNLKNAHAFCIPWFDGETNSCGFVFFLLEKQIVC